MDSEPEGPRRCHRILRSSSRVRMPDSLHTCQSDWPQREPDEHRSKCRPTRRSPYFPITHGLVEHSHHGPLTTRPQPRPLHNQACLASPSPRNVTSFPIASAQRATCGHVKGPRKLLDSIRAPYLHNQNYQKELWITTSRSFGIERMAATRSRQENSQRGAR